MAAIQQKRKRDSADMAAARPAPAINAMDQDFDTAYMHADDEAMEAGEVDFEAAFPNTEPETAVEEEEQAEETPQQQQQTKPAEPVNASDTAAAAMAQYHTMTVPQSTEQSFMTGQRGEGNGQQDTPSVDAAGSTAPRTGSFGDLDTSAIQASPNGGEASPGKDGSSMTPSRGKPPVGTEEWHKIRKDNHKEVERRRRETINEGINELAKIVPGCEKNKGSILGRAVQFITQLKENETQNIEKWTLEKLLTEQAIAELSSSVDKLKAECQRAWAECEQWKKMAAKAGVAVDSKNVSGAAAGGDGDAEGEDVE